MLQICTLETGYTGNIDIMIGVSQRYWIPLGNGIRT